MQPTNKEKLDLIEKLKRADVELSFNTEGVIKKILYLGKGFTWNKRQKQVLQSITALDWTAWDVRDMI